jgi:hypothetical protein
VPWKLLKKEKAAAAAVTRKRVYVCPEPSCLHHNPAHALGDLVGIKKHYRSVSGSAPDAPRAMQCSLTIRPMLRLVGHAAIPVTVVVFSQGMICLEQGLKFVLVLHWYRFWMVFLLFFNAANLENNID